MIELSDPSQKVVFLKKIKTYQQVSPQPKAPLLLHPTRREWALSTLQRGAQAELPALVDDTATQWLRNPNRREYANLRLKYCTVNKEWML